MDKIFFLIPPIIVSYIYIYILKPSNNKFNSFNKKFRVIVGWVRSNQIMLFPSPDNLLTFSNGKKGVFKVGHKCLYFAYFYHDKLKTKLLFYYWIIVQVSFEWAPQKLDANKWWFFSFFKKSGNWEKVWLRIKLDFNCTTILH